MMSQLGKLSLDGLVYLRANDQCDLVVMGKHGLVTWGDTCRGC